MNLTQKCPKGIITHFLTEDFFHLPPVSLTPVANLELQISPRIFEKIWNGPNDTIRGLGETDSWKKPEAKNFVTLSREPYTTKKVWKVLGQTHAVCAPSLINLSMKWPPLYFTVFLVSYPSSFLRNKCKMLHARIIVFFEKTKKCILQHEKNRELNTRAVHNKANLRIHV